MDQVETGRALLRPTRLTPVQFKALIRQRGWQMADAATRWAIQPATRSRVAADPEREIRWDDLVCALPALTGRAPAAVSATAPGGQGRSRRYCFQRGAAESLYPAAVCLGR